MIFAFQPKNNIDAPGLKVGDLVELIRISDTNQYRAKNINTDNEAGVVFTQDDIMREFKLITNNLQYIGSNSDLTVNKYYLIKQETNRFLVYTDGGGEWRITLYYLMLDFIDNPLDRDEIKIKQKIVHNLTDINISGGGSSVLVNKEMAVDVVGKVFGIITDYSYSIVSNTPVNKPDSNEHGGADNTIDIIKLLRNAIAYQHMKTVGNGTVYMNPILIEDIAKTIHKSIISHNLTIVRESERKELKTRVDLEKEVEFLRTCLKNVQPVSFQQGSINRLEDAVLAMERLRTELEDIHATVIGIKEVK